MWQYYSSDLIILGTGKVDLSLNLRDDGGNYPLAWAVRMVEEAIVKVLLDSGKVYPSLILKDNERWTPVAWASRNSFRNIVKLLRLCQQR